MNPLYTYRGEPYHIGQKVSINHQDGGYWKPRRTGIIRGLNQHGAVFVEMAGVVRAKGKTDIFPQTPTPEP